MPCTKGMTSCYRACRHRSFVAEYRAAREHDVQQAEAVTNGWAAEYEEYIREHPMITFKAWLVQMTGWSTA